MLGSNNQMVFSYGRWAPKLSRSPNRGNKVQAFMKHMHNNKFKYQKDKFLSEREEKLIELKEKC